MFKNALVWIIWKTLPSCKDVTAVISRSLETKLSFREKITLKTHLWSCIACHRYLSQIKFMSEVVALQEKRIEKGELSPTLNSAPTKPLKEAIKSANR